MKAVKLGPGRPRKYGRPSRAVTVTLPDDVIERLRAMDVDLGRAIVGLAEREGRPRVRRVTTAELNAYGKHAVILVNPVRTLKRVAGVQLVPVGNGLALISLDPSNSIPELELSLRDALDQPGVPEPERRTLEAIGDILRQARRSRKASVRERTIIVLEAKPRHGRRDVHQNRGER